MKGRNWGRDDKHKLADDHLGTGQAQNSFTHRDGGTFWVTDSIVGIWRAFEGIFSHGRESGWACRALYSVVDLVLTIFF